MDNVFVSTPYILYIKNLFFSLRAMLHSWSARDIITIGLSFLLWGRFSFAVLFCLNHVFKSLFVSSLLNFATAAPPIRPIAFEGKREACIFERLVRRLGTIVSRISVAIFLAGSQFCDFPTSRNGQLRRSSLWNRVPRTSRSNGSYCDHFSISFPVKSPIERLSG